MQNDCSRYSFVLCSGFTEHNGFSLIASGSSSDTGLILLWQAKRAPLASAKTPTPLSLRYILCSCLHLLMLAAAMAFFLQNVCFPGEHAIIRGGVGLLYLLQANFTTWTRSVVLTGQLTPPPAVLEVVRSASISSDLVVDSEVLETCPSRSWAQPACIVPWRALCNVQQYVSYGLHNRSLNP
ncbi:hypothetical protein OH77DRAFT_293439 [Trametes cingulata]|nr:hypothetical protein OH77DRAFT_293439 [Trametes cingulata]